MDRAPALLTPTHAVVAESDRAVRELLTVILTRAGFSVTPAADLDGAVGACLEAPAVAVVLLDGAIADGRPGALTTLRHHAPAVRLLIVGSEMPPGFDGPRTARLAKPFTVTEVLGAVDRLLAAP